MEKIKKRNTKPETKLTALLLTLAMAVSLAMPAAAAETASAAAVRLSKTEGTVKISKSSGRSVSLRDNMRLYSGYHIVTSAKSYAWIDLDDTKLIKEDASSETEVRKSGKKLEVNVVSGQVFFNVAESLKEDETLNISTSTMVVGIRGTTGWVRVVDRWKTEVCLLEGTVQCVVTDPVTGQLKTAVLRGGDVAECIVYPQDKAGDKCDITMKKQTVDGIPGYALTDLVRDVPLCDKILEDSGLDILGGLAQSGGGPEDGRAPGGSAPSREVIRETEKRQEQEEQQTGQKLEEIQQKVSEQDNNVSQTGVWGKDNNTTSSGSGGGSSSTPAVSGTMKLTDVQVQALLDGAGSIAVRANTDAADTTPNKNLLEIDNGLNVAAGKTLTLDSGVDVAVRPGKTLQVDGTLHTSGNLTDEGIVNVTSGDTLRVGGDLTLGPGTLNVSATGRVVVDGTFNILTGGILQPQASTAVVMAKGFSGGGGAIGLPSGWKISATTDSEGYYHLLPDTSFLISYDANGGTLGAGAGGNTPVAMDTNEDGTIDLSAIPDPTRSGYMFLGWFTAATGGTQVTEDTVFTADATIYARWVHSIYFDFNYLSDDGYPYAPVEAWIDTDGKIIDGHWPTDPTRDGYTFAGWWTTAATGGTQVTADTVFTANATVYARWGATPSGTYQITFNDNYPDGSSSSTGLRTTGSDGKISNWPTDPSLNPDQGQYTFEGWFTEATGGTKIESTHIFTADTQLFAHWSGWGYIAATKTLTIEGTGPMSNYNNASDAPWNSLSNSIETIIIKDGITKIGDLSFVGCTALTSVTIPNSVKSIGAYAFKNTALTSITIPDQVHTIWQEAFSDTKLINIMIPASVQLINNQAFQNCTSLGNVTFAENSALTTIASYAFNGCTSLTRIEIPDTVSSIQPNTFTGCSSLAEITIPVSVSSIGISAFSGCTVLNIINYGGTVAQWNTITTPTDATGLEGKTITCTDGNVTVPTGG